MSHKQLTEQATHFLDVATYQTTPDAPVDLTESTEVVTARINDAANHLSRMFGAHSSVSKAPAQINEAVDKYLSRNKQNNREEKPTFEVGDRVQTIMQGQQEGTVEKVEEKNGLTKVYHRHDSGNLYASSPTNLKIIKKAKQIEEAYDDVKHNLRKTHQSDVIEKKKIVQHHLDIIHDLKEKMENATSNEEYEKHRQAHALETAKLANAQTYLKGGIVESAVDHILEQMNVSSFTQLDESVQQEVLSIASDIAPHI